MGLFTSSTEKGALGQNPVNPDITKQYGSGAEQDRYGSHFTVPSETIDRGVNKLKEVASYKGDGAEQDRYGAHFSPALHSLDAQKVPAAAASIAAKGNEADTYGLGYDGQQRAKLLAGSGTGAEQDRLGGHFGLDKDTVANAAQRVQDGARDLLGKK
ncbi:hypothetical protein IQ07DRAFT_582817 [Pyrenochaeta sp. DS3sAY3a]|nr:hypothetical protein IQ07DRAFT_582817 [Pyrenochaeta sp. DS3sAY3a]